MMPRFLIYFLSAFLALVLGYRIIRALNFKEKMTFTLFFLLFSTIISQLLVTDFLPGWYEPLALSLVILAGLWFPLEMLSTQSTEKRAVKQALKQLRKEKGSFHEIASAAQLLAKAGLGALIAIERKQPLGSWQGKGIRVDAQISREIIYSVFTPPGALHDGGVIIRNNRLMAAGVIFPLTKATDFPKELGTRHRAAVGFSETTDALCMVVSEENGSISFADRGTLFYDIPPHKIGQVLEQALKFRLKNKRNKSPLQTYEPAKV